jgi:antigen flippase
VALGTASPDPPATPAVGPMRPLQAIVALGGIQALTMIAGLARTKVLAVTLGPAGVGVAGVVDQAVALVAQLGSLSIPFVALKFMSRARDDGSAELRRIFTALVMTVVAASTAATVIATSLSWLQPSLFGSGLAGYQLAVLIGLVGVPAIAIAAVFRNVMAALERHRESALAAFFAAVLTVAGAYVGVRTGGLVGLYVANTIVTVVTVVGMYLYLNRVVHLQFVGGMRTADVRQELQRQPGLANFAASMYILALTSPLAYLMARSLLLSTHGEIAAGFAAAAYGLAVSVRLVLNQANGLYLTPIVNRSTSKSVRTDAVAEYLRILTVLVVLSTVVIALFPRPWLTLLYSEDFAQAASLVVYFLLAEAVLLAAGVYQALLIGFDDIKGFLASTLAGHAITMTLTWAIVDRLGGFGVAIAFLAGNFVMLVGTAVRLLRTHDGRSAFASLPPLVVALAAMGALGWWSARPTAPSVAIRIVALVAAGTIALAFLRADERRWLLRPWRTSSSARIP